MEDLLPRLTQSKLLFEVEPKNCNDYASFLLPLKWAQKSEKYIFNIFIQLVFKWELYAGPNYVLLLFF